ncbi:hypothetical protein [Paenibacillus popilliae]|nr:hypothetical protein [Paenibacillus popilliae]
MNKKLFILSLAIASMLVASQSAFADKITVTKNGKTGTVYCSKNNCTIKV